MRITDKLIVKIELTMGQFPLVKNFDVNNLLNIFYSSKKIDRH